MCISIMYYNNIFIITTLMYLFQDEDCRLLTVGSWYAMSGYGLAFTRNSKYVSMFNKRLLDLRANGDLERLRRYVFIYDTINLKTIT